MKIQFLLYGIAQVLASVNDVTNGTLCRTSLTSSKEHYLSGDDIIISCTSKDSSVNAKDLFFRHKNGQFLSPSSIVNGTTVELLVQTAQKEDGGSYECYYSNCTLSVESWKTIHVGDLPQQPVNFECISFNFFNMSCSWRSNDTISVWKLEYRIINEPLEWKCCPSCPHQNGSCDFFSSPRCDFLRYPDFIQSVDYQAALMIGLMLNGNVLVTEEYKSGQKLFAWSGCVAVEVDPGEHAIFEDQTGKDKSSNVVIQDVDLKLRGGLAQNMVKIYELGGFRDSDRSTAFNENCIDTWMQKSVISKSSLAKPKLSKLVTMNLTALNNFGSKWWNYTVYTGPQIVKLNPVEIQYAEASKRNELNISWKASKPYFDNNTCLVSWNSQWDTFWESKLLNFTSDIEKMSTRISNLRSNIYYTVNISCRFSSSNHWSNATVVTNKTRPTAPDRAPDITNGSFTEVANCTENITSCLYVYWKPLPIWEWNAPNLIYNIKLYDNNYNVIETDVSGNQSFAGFALKEDIRKPYKITISSHNDNGFSRNMNTIEIHEDIVPSYKVIVERNISNQGSKYLVTWIASSPQNQAISRVTYFWALCCYRCQEICPPVDVTDIHWEDVDTHNNTKWRDVDTQTDSKWINLTNTENNDWQFGVSIETSNSVKTAISWSDCVFPHYGQYNDVPKLNVQPSTLNDTVVEILLLFSFCKLEMRPFVYQIFFKKTMPPENDIGTKTEVRNFTATPWLQSFLLDGLEANTEYLISLVIIGRFFRSKLSKEYHVKTGVMMTHPPTDPKLDPKYAIIIAITVSTIIVMLGFLFLIYMHRTCKEKCRGPPIDVPRTAWLKVPNMIEVSDGKVTSRKVEDDDADHSYMEQRAMTSDTNREERGLNIVRTSEDGQRGDVVVSSVDDILFSLSIINQDEFCSDQKLELSTLRIKREMSRSVTNLYESHFPCKDLKAGERGLSGHIPMDAERWLHLNLNRNKEHKVHSYMSAPNLLSGQLMDVLVDERATLLGKDEVSECFELKRDLKTKCYVHNYKYEKDAEDSSTQLRRTANENIEMKESMSDVREEVNGMYHSTLNNDTEPYVTVTDICDTERHVTAIDTCGTPSIDSYMLTLPSGTPFVISSNVEQENYKSSSIIDYGDEDNC